MNKLKYPRFYIHNPTKRNITQMLKKPSSIYHIYNDY